MADVLRPAPPPDPGARVRAVVGSVRGRVAGHLLVVAAGIAVVMVAAGVALWLLKAPASPARVDLPMAARAASTTAPGAARGAAAAPPATTTAELVVQAAGAVVRPGVYRLAGGSRVIDLIAAAGGLQIDADTDAVPLAAKLSDGARVVVPLRGTSGSGGSTGIGATGTTVAEPLDLNTASAGQLATLPGVGPATAAAIVDHRERHGPFSSVDALLEVRGIGPAKLDAVRDLVRV